MSGTSAAVPLSILAGSALIAGALYLGLTHRTGPQEHVAAERPTTPAPPVAPTVAPPVATPVAPPDPAKVEAAARAALERHRAALVERCWRPLAAKEPEPASVPLSFDLTFDARGKLVARGISDQRSAFRPGLSSCLMGQAIDLEIAPPGVDVRVQVMMTLP